MYNKIYHIIISFLNIIDDSQVEMFLNVFRQTIHLQTSVGFIILSTLRSGFPIEIQVAEYEVLSAE